MGAVTGARGEAGAATGGVAPEEREEGEVARGGGGGQGAAASAAEALVAVVPGPPPQIDVRVDQALLHCQACLLPLNLKPPVFKVDHPRFVRDLRNR